MGPLTNAIFRRPFSFLVALAAVQFIPESRAQPLDPLDFGEPSDRRVIEHDPASVASDGYLAAKRAEASAMVRWFDARLRTAKIEVAKHVVEHKFNQELFTRLQPLSGSIAEVRVLEARKQTELDDFLAEQLALAVEMAEADLAAARARLDALNFVRGL